LKIYIVAVWEKGDEKEQDRIIALEWAFNETVGREHAHAALNEYSVENYHIAYWCLKMDSESFIQEEMPEPACWAYGKKGMAALIRSHSITLCNRMID